MAERQPNKAEWARFILGFAYGLVVSVLTYFGIRLAFTHSHTADLVPGSVTFVSMCIFAFGLSYSGGYLAMLRLRISVLERKLEDAKSGNARG